MPRSTAKFISYDLRPAKQSERRILIDLLSIGGDCGLPINTYRYVGMGANRFYDYLLLHKYLGINKMVSLEHDQKMFLRAEFNAPYKFIEVKQLTSAAFISGDLNVDPTIYWLDYDGGIGQHLVKDIISLSPKLKQGDFCFVTVSGTPPGAIDKSSDEERLIFLHENLPEVSGACSIEDVERSNFPDAVHKILIATFKNAFAQRRDGRFVPFLQVEYADSQPMVTVGGAFLSDGQALNMASKVRIGLPFLDANTTSLYEIRSLHLTERERAIFDRAVTSPKRRCVERNALMKLGFKDIEIDAYKDLVRYLPRYVETMV